ncbi:hypothetical protein H8R29_08885 [Priestia megaterium]|uniref:Uncharacterized protein n=1 Tax=Priestia megaterium (strain ATCC 14581 / DSM 32 / CCUG 1817 / JCM 2506 / NBRC 15308 / NCIMB 9376 / NCTC 10342 / NRRL B-14308 / VKM B-512 / Ford 19) TaxID=1348623 RepID=A0A0B6AES6_PRIM2|nr:hypothetical protein [Priestia megaterium]AJI23395.1 hypothetical protein BG04_4057 [Priestia megaterium NBRC 15308 = ATCC 14581]KFM96328.1 hypothetical protein DJ91_1214 [Priestia megaterium]KGJ78487.1 hypothetical protein BMT_23465 [Priestia megaterium NBRC 15308 = ATCC 14581]MDR4232682.1 hypothetical protein [Priestia megaterium]MED3809502.1 hypothetical protein [Priestia megaterium]
MKHSRLLLLSLISSLFVILVALFQWDLVDIITEFLMLPIWLFVYAFFIIMTIWTLIHLFKKRKWQPFVIQLITISLWFFFPFNQVNLDLNFKIDQDKREEVATKIENGVIKPNVSDSPSLIQLPKKYTQLSKGGGDIVVETKGKAKSILFFTYRGMLDNFSGFVYNPNDNKPSKSDFNGDFKQIKKVHKNWYYVSSY